jgi:hypothetical protein
MVSIENGFVSFEVNSQYAYGQAGGQHDLCRDEEDIISQKTIILGENNSFSINFFNSLQIMMLHVLITKIVTGNFPIHYS